MNIEFNIKINEETPRYLHIANMEVRAIINGKEYHSLEHIREDAEPVYFDYIWEKIGKDIKESYMKTLGNVK